MENMGKLTQAPILVTGGTGFVGSHLIEELAATHSRIIVPFRSLDPHSYFAQKQLDKKVVMAIGDCKDRMRMADIISKYEIETIIHLGAQPIVATAYTNPSETLETNIMGTVHVLEAARQTGHVKSIIIASSDKAYGKSTSAYKETDPLCGDHPYEVSKSAADLIAFSYMKTYGMPIIVTRFGNIYGPGDLNFNRIVPGIMQTLCTGEMLEIRSNGKYMRDYLFVKDVASAYIYLLEHFSRAKNEAYNISSDDSYSVVGLIKTCKKIFKKDIPFEIKNTAINEIPEQSLNCDKIHALGWKSRYSIEKGLEESYAWYLRHFTDLHRIELE
jgi:CDP-glucose 4,6-dehydratase